MNYADLFILVKKLKEEISLIKCVFDKWLKYDIIGIIFIRIV